MATRSSRLLRWYRRSRRRLPWRENPEPYRVWVSELMLQQTQVKTVVPYFERFIERFPDVFRLAAASEEEVLAAWSGLGYYRRARSLHRAARVIVSELEGRFPEDVPGWMALPGVGRYTAGAVVSIALSKPAPILDGNVARVLSRWFVVRGDPRSASTRKKLWALAEDVLPRRSVSEFNQALMELGALVCTPKRPRCLVCPVRPDCGAHRLGIENELPERSPKPEAVRLRVGTAVVEEGGRLLMFRRHGERLMDGLWEFPSGVCLAGEPPHAAVAREASERHGVSLQTGSLVGRFRHSVVNRRMEFHVYRAQLRDAAVPGRRHRWVKIDAVGSLPASSIVHKTLRALGKP